MESARIRLKFSAVLYEIAFLPAGTVESSQVVVSTAGYSQAQALPGKMLTVPQACFPAFVAVARRLPKTIEVVATQKVVNMGEVLTFNLRFLYASIDQNRWLRWFLEAAIVVVAVGLVSVLAKDANLLVPFGIATLDLAYLASVGVLFFVLALVFISVIGIPLFRCNGVLLMLAGIGVFEYQVYEYMKLGWWRPFPLRDFTDALFLTWTLDQATVWPAVLARNFLQETALSIALIGIGALWHALANKFLDTTLHDIRLLEREAAGPDEELPAEQLAALSQPANAETFDEVVPTVAEPIVLAEAKLLRAKRPDRDSSIPTPWLVDKHRDAGPSTGAAESDSRRKPSGK